VWRFDAAGIQAIRAEAGVELFVRGLFGRGHGWRIAQAHGSNSITFAELRQSTPS
jgi:hypothetical protein